MPRVGARMFEMVKAFHEAFHTESTWAFVLPIALIFALMSGSIAWVIDKGYKNSRDAGENPIVAVLRSDKAIAEKRLEEAQSQLAKRPTRDEVEKLKRELDDKNEQKLVSDRRREIQLKLAGFLERANTVRQGWLSTLNQPEEIQRPNLAKTTEFHKAVEDYLKTIPHGTVYLARFNNSLRPTGSYPTGLNMNVGGGWDWIMSDVTRINEIMNDPDLGKD